MDTLLQLAIGNLLSPMVLFFALGVAAGWLKYDLAIPEPISKGLSLYLMLAIGFKGGVELATNGVAGTVAVAMALACSCSVSACLFLLMPCSAPLHGSDAAVAAAGDVGHDGVALGADRLDHLDDRAGARGLHDNIDPLLPVELHHRDVPLASHACNPLCGRVVEWDSDDQVERERYGQGQGDIDRRIGLRQ